MILAASAALLVAAPSVAGREPPAASLSAVPARLELAGTGRTSVALTNFGRRPVHVTAAPGSFAVDLRGRPALARRGTVTRTAAPWLSVRPRVVAIGPGGTAPIEVAARVPARAEPGDHHALVLLATRPVGTGRVGVRMRLGVRVVVRVPGAVVRDLRIRSLRTRRVGAARRLDLRVLNRGNVTEEVSPADLAVVLTARGRTLARVGVERREILPATNAIASAWYRGGYRGRALARVERHGRPRRAFWIRL